MKNTPFQIALRNELSRLEQLSGDYVQGNHSLVSCAQAKPIKQGGFLLQLFRGRISLRSNFRISY
jgi:hypothetical protein